MALEGLKVVSELQASESEQSRELVSKLTTRKPTSTDLNAKHSIHVVFLCTKYKPNSRPGQPSLAPAGQQKCCSKLMHSRNRGSLAYMADRYLCT